MNFYTAHLSYDELERLHYWAGSTEAAALFAELVDLKADNEQYEKDSEEKYDQSDMNKKDNEIKILENMIKTANDKLTTLYRTLDDAKRINKGPILIALATIDLELP